MANTIIGIDPGTNTGVAVIESGIITYIKTCDILSAMDIVRKYHDVLLCVEDASKYNPAHARGKDLGFKKMGAGSVMRDVAIWRSFAEREQIKIALPSPKDVGSAYDHESIFRQSTLYKLKRLPSKHARDAVRIAEVGYRLVFNVTLKAVFQDPVI